MAGANVSRIIAGSRGGRRLAMPSTARTRPTTDRVREALFSALTSWLGRADADVADALSNLSFLDLFSGSGAVGLEAASRGAAPVVAVESSRSTAAMAQRNAVELGLPVDIRTMSVVAFLRTRPRFRFDLVFADPPYELSTAEVEQVLADLAARGWLAPEAMVVFERAHRSPPISWPPGVDRHWSKRYGETVLFFGTLEVSSQRAEQLSLEKARTERA